MKTNLKSKIALLMTLMSGITAGIITQRIPELKSYTDQVIRPIEKSNFFKQLKIKMGYREEKVYLAETYHPYSEKYKQPSSLPNHPISSFLIHRPNYSLAYDAQHRNPAWVYEHLTADSVKGEIKDSFIQLKEDENIPPHLRATLADYKGKSLDYAQMASKDNHRSNPESLRDNFFLTNMCPQCSQLHQGYWSKLEKYARDLTKDYRNVYVITGPLYLPYYENGVRFVKYRVIGPNDIAVPSHFFKVLVLENEQNKKEMIAYVLPNYEIPLDTPLDSFRTSIQKIEKAAGMMFTSD